MRHHYDRSTVIYITCYLLNDDGRIDVCPSDDGGHHYGPALNGAAKHDALLGLRAAIDTELGPAGGDVRQLDEQRHHASDLERLRNAFVDRYARCIAVGLGDEWFRAEARALRAAIDRE